MGGGKKRGLGRKSPPKAARKRRTWRWPGGREGKWAQRGT